MTRSPKNLLQISLFIAGGLLMGLSLQQLLANSYWLYKTITLIASLAIGLECFFLGFKLEYFLAGHLKPLKNILIISALLLLIFHSGESIVLVIVLASLTWVLRLLQAVSAAQPQTVLAEKASWRQTVAVYGATVLLGIINYRVSLDFLKYCTLVLNKPVDVDLPFLPLILAAYLGYMLAETFIASFLSARLVRAAGANVKMSKLLWITFALFILIQIVAAGLGIGQ